MLDILESLRGMLPASTTTTIATASGISFSVLLLVGWYIRIRQRCAALLAIRGKVVLITGASSGLGEACAHVFYRAGCKLVLSGRRVPELDRVVRELMQLNVNIPVYQPIVAQLDISKFSDIPAFVQKAVGFHGHIDIVINNAGISYRGEIERTSLDVDIALMNVNYFGQVALTKAILPGMIVQQSGHIVAISSVQGKVSIPFRSAYGASKHAMQSFFDCLRAEVAHQGISVTVVSPGYIRTDLSLSALTGDGSLYGVLDEELRLGMTSEYAAEMILKSVALRENDVVIAPLIHRLASYLRSMFPNVFTYIMTSRANKQRATMRKFS